MNSKRGSNQVWLSQQEGGFGVKRPQDACDSAFLANILYNGLRDEATLCSLTTRQRFRDNPYLAGTTWWNMRIPTREKGIEQPITENNDTLTMFVKRLQYYGMGMERRL
jgi:hypothetical protein